MYYAIVVDDPDAMRDATGEVWQVGDVCSYGSEIGSADILKSRGLVAVEIGTDPPDFERMRWDREKRELVAWQMSKSDIAEALVVAEANFLMLQAAYDALPDGSEEAIARPDIEMATAVLIDQLKG